MVGTRGMLDDARFRRGFCWLAEHALVQGDGERAATLLRQARTHQAVLPRADMLTARIAEKAGDAAGALLLYLHALESSPGLALEIIPRHRPELECSVTSIPARAQDDFSEASSPDIHSVPVAYWRVNLSDADSPQNRLDIYRRPVSIL